MLVAPSFDGRYIFGICVQMVTVDPPRRKQINHYLGIDGVEVLDLGALQRHTEVQGRLIAPDLVTLGAIEDDFRSYRNPFAYTLVTTEGLVWPDVVLESFQPKPPIRSDGATVWRDYTARFLHCRG